MKCSYKGCPENGTHRVRLPGQVARTLDVCLQHQIVLEGMMAKLCLVTDCENSQAAKGVCSVHYQRFRYFGLVPKDGIKDATQADAIAAQWRKLSEEAKVKTGPAIPKTPKVEPAHVVAKVVQPVATPAQPKREKTAKQTGRAMTGPGSTKLLKLQADLTTMTQARDRLAGERKELVEKIRHLEGQNDCLRSGQVQPSKEAQDYDAKLVEVAGYVQVLEGQIRTLQATNDGLTGEVERLTKLDQRMEPVRAALAALNLPVMDSYADAVHHLADQGHRAAMALLAEFGDTIGKPVEHGEDFESARGRLLGFAQEWCRLANGSDAEQNRVVESLKRENAALIDRVNTLKRARDDLNELVRRKTDEPSAPPAQPIPSHTRLAALLRESLSLRLAFVDAMQDRAHRTLRKAAEDPALADSMASDLLSPEPG